jgi:hypothetical protein
MRCSFFVLKRTTQNESRTTKGGSMRVPCEFFLIRYVPDVVKGEFVNIGVLLREAGGTATPRVQFTRDWSRVRCMDAEADIALLEAVEQEIAARLRLAVTAQNPKGILSILQDSLSNSLQMTEPRATLAENLATEMELLLKLYVEPVKVPRLRTKTGRAAIAGAMRTEFERAGVWAMMRKRIAAAEYTRAGDPLRIDCGYRPNGVVKMFQAVSLAGDVETAKVLAYSAPQLRDGVVRIEGAKLELTAVVEPLRAINGESSEDGDESIERYRFGVETMERQEIRVVTLNDLARAAATAQRELGL